MAKNFFITDFTERNYVECPKSTNPIHIQSCCHGCRYFKGGGIDIETKKNYVNCMYQLQDSNVQLEMELKAK